MRSQAFPHSGDVMWAIGISVCKLGVRTTRPAVSPVHGVQGLWPSLLLVMGHIRWMVSPYEEAFIANVIRITFL